MLREEFEKLYGAEVDPETYNKIIEPMYMTTDLDKVTFVKLLDKKVFALRTQKQIINRVKKISAGLYETFHHYTDFEANRELEDLERELNKRWPAGHWMIAKAMEFTCYYPRKLYYWIGDDMKIIELNPAPRGYHNCCDC